MENYKTVSPVVVVAIERWLFTRGSTYNKVYRALTGKSLVFWIGSLSLMEFLEHISHKITRTPKRCSGHDELICSYNFNVI